MEKRILVVEDDRALNEGIAFALRREGYLTNSAYSLREAREKLEERMHLVLLDINLPDGDGREFLGSVLAGQPAPVLLLTARDTEEDMLQGFRAGCDDYITKPFSMPVLLMKIAAVLKRSEGVSRQIYTNGELLYDFENKTLTRRGEAVELTALECRLMELFLHNRGIVLTRERILDRIWDADERFVESRTLNVTIRRLRMKVEENPEEPIYIKTVFGLGYKWEDGQK
ncbi:MAG: response regulator transcription factor [Lachnospiraceae bacterium]|jgi:two-component system response regulator RegX3|nr:response regulator transcription factor [Lachnospiraceae bacterium]MCI8986444.1 response regulator transcription factor [Lachnospiraceae bacterium]